MSRQFNDMYFSMNEEERTAYDIGCEEAENTYEKFKNSLKTKNVGQIRILLAVSEAMEPKNG